MTFKEKHEVSFKEKFEKSMIEKYGSRKAYKEAMSKRGKTSWDKHGNWLSKLPEEERRERLSEMGKKGAKSRWQKN